MPYLFPVLEFSADEHFKVVGSRQNSVLFRPREWRGIDSGPCDGNVATIALCKHSSLTPEEMAREINGYKPGK